MNVLKAISCAGGLMLVAHMVWPKQWALRFNVISISKIGSKRACSRVSYLRARQRD